MTEASDDTKAVEKRSWGCFGWLWRLTAIGFLVLVGLLVWVNGPGMRWLGPKVARHFFEKADMAGDLRLGGTLLGGVNIYDLEIKSPEGALEHVVVNRLETDYRFMEVIKGKVRGVSGNGIKVGLRLIEKEKVEEDSPPPDFAGIGETLENLRAQIIPVAVDLQDVSFSAKKDDNLVVALGSTSLVHVAGTDLIELNLGEVTDSNGKRLESQDVDIVWDERRLALDKLDLLPIVGIRDLEMNLPEDGEVSASLDVRVDESVLSIDVGKGIEDLQVDLREGVLDFVPVMEGLGVEIPLKGRLTSLSVEMRKFFPEWQTAIGSAELSVEGFSWDGWDVAKATLGANLNDGDISLELVGDVFASPLTITASTEFERQALETEGFKMGGISGDLRIGNLDDVLRGLNTKLEMGANFTEFPKSEVAGPWNLDLEGGFGGAGADLTIKAKEVEATPIRIKATYADDKVTVSNLDLDGISISANYDVASSSYNGEGAIEDFTTASIDPWLNGAGVELPGDGIVSLKWKGEGDLKAKTHGGSVAGLNANWDPKDVEGNPPQPPISATGDVEYSWPQQVKVTDLVATTQGQKISLNAQLEDNALNLERLNWMDGETELASGSGKLPVPEDFSKVKEFIENDTRPLDLRIETQVIPLTKLKPWVPGLDSLDPSATGKMDIAVSGSLANPEVLADIAIRDISVQGRTDIPKSDLTLKIEAKDQVAKVSAEAVAPDYAPAVLNAEMPFLPKRWAENPELVKSAPVKARLDLPNLNLSRFQSLVPDTESLSGVATGNIVVGGTVGEPVVNGSIKLTGGGVEFGNEMIPDCKGINLEVEANLQTVKLTGGISNVEGGTVSLNGGLNLKNPSGEGLGDLNLSVSGTGLPVLRNEFLIMRANAEIRVDGTMAKSVVSGTVGIVDSIFYKDMDLIPVGKPFVEPSAAALPSIDAKKKKTEANTSSSSPLADWTMNVAIKTIDPILIRGNLGKGEVDVGLRIEGNLSDPKPNGQVRIRNTKARLPFTTLEIREGYLNFTPKTGFDPVLDIRGYADPRPYRVEIYAYGNASNPQLLLTSQPPLPENEIMTLLATGTTTEGLEDSQAASSRATQLLIEEIRRGRFLFGDKLRPFLGVLDNVDFSIADSNPYDSDSYTSANVKLSDKWSVSAGIGEQGDQRVLATWRLRFK
ncbi:MAG: translocation/assembly module TamB domain-containing protein [Luteolibacter sp.]